MTQQKHINYRNYLILVLIGFLIYVLFEPNPEPKEDIRVFVLEKENERLKVLYNEQKQIAINSIRVTDSLKALKPKVITKYKRIYTAIDSMTIKEAIEAMDSVYKAHKVDSANREKFVLKNVEKVNELTELNELQVSIIGNQDSTINTQKNIIAIADTLHSNNSLIIDDLKDKNKSLRKKLFKEKVKVRLVAIGGVTLVVLAILAL